MPQAGIQAETLTEKIADAQEHPSYGNRAGGIIKQYSRLGMALPCLPSGMNGLDLFVSRQSWRASYANFGIACMCPQEQPPPKGPSSACTLHGAFLLVS